MEHSQEGYKKKQIKGTEAQFLIEKIVRERIYDSLYYKQSLFACTALIVIDKAIALTSIGGQYANQKPSDFLCLLLKLLQLQPEEEIIDLYLSSQYKYLTALAALYIRLTGDSPFIYKRLEPLLLDRRKLRLLQVDGTLTITTIDSFIDSLLNDGFLFIILPRLVKRFVLEDSNLLQQRISPLSFSSLMDLDSPIGIHSPLEVPLPEVSPLNMGSPLKVEIDINTTSPLNVEIDTTMMAPLKVEIDATMMASLDNTKSTKKDKGSKKKISALFKKLKEQRLIVDGDGDSSGKYGKESSVKETGAKSGLNGGGQDSALSFHETNILRANLGLPPLQ